MPLQNSTANNALLEGMASGLPVVATDLIATRTYLAGKGAIFSPQGDVGAAVAAVERLAGDPSQMERLGREARAQAETLDWTNIASEHAALFEYVCGRDKRTRTPVPAK
jgi:glycosyltransferase involved in cell wall biosynthesis